jgi:hypothetical protein
VGAKDGIPDIVKDLRGRDEGRKRNGGRDDKYSSLLEYAGVIIA